MSATKRRRPARSSSRVRTRRRPFAASRLGRPRPTRGCTGRADAALAPVRSPPPAEGRRAPSRGADARRRVALGDRCAAGHRRRGQQDRRAEQAVRHSRLVTRNRRFVTTRPRRGVRRKPPPGSRRPLDDWLPTYEFEEPHSIGIARRADEIGRALRGVTLTDLPIASALIAVRGLPARFRGEPPIRRDEAVVDHFASLGVLLEERPGLLVAGVAGRFWKLSGGLERFAGPDAFRAYEPDGSAKAVVDFVWA